MTQLPKTILECKKAISILREEINLSKISFHKDTFKVSEYKIKKKKLAQMLTYEKTLKGNSNG